MSSCPWKGFPSVLDPSTRPTRIPWRWLKDGRVQIKRAPDVILPSPSDMLARRSIDPRPLHVMEHPRIDGERAHTADGAKRVGTWGSAEDAARSWTSITTITKHWRIRMGQSWQVDLFATELPMLPLRLAFTTGIGRKAHRSRHPSKTPKQRPWSSCHRCEPIVSLISIRPTRGLDIPQLEMLASLQCQLCLRFAVGTLQSEDDLFGGLGFFVEDGLCLTTVSGLLAVVSPLSLSDRGGLCEWRRQDQWMAFIHRSRWSLVQDFSRTLPALYCVTLCWVCFLQSLPLQYVRRVFGTLTCASVWLAGKVW